MSVPARHSPVDTEIEPAIVRFVVGKTKRDIPVDEDLFGAGGMSSLFAMELVVFLENTFGMAIGGADLKLDNFRTVRTMVGLVTRLSEGTR